VRRLGPVALRQARRFARSPDAASAVEFALIAPLLLFIFLGTFEITRAFSVNRKVEEMAATVSRYVSRTDGVTRADLASFVKASTAVMFPNSVEKSVLQVVIRRIDKKGDDGAEVNWSYDWANEGVSTTRVDSVFVPVPTSVIRTDITYVHKVTFTSMLSRFNLSEFRLSASSTFAPDKLSPIEFKGT
jgi:Flp pilus assembly protein TadG